MCVCVCVCDYHFFVITYLIKQHRSFVSTYFCIDSMKMPYRFYDIR